MSSSFSAISKRASAAYALGYGGASVVLWSLGAYLYCLLKAVPLFEAMAITQLCGGWIFLLLDNKKFSLKRQWTSFVHGWPFVLLLFLNQICYVLAFRIAPAAQVDLINYLWPMMIVIGEALCRKDSLSVRSWMGMALGFGGVVILVLPSMVGSGIHVQYFAGYVLAAMAALSWTAYTIGKGRYQKEGKASSMSEDVVNVGLINSVLFMGAGHWQMPSVSEVSILFLLGTAVYGAAYPCWRRGLKSGHYPLIGGLANAIPVLSIAWLVLGGMAPVTWSLLAASLLVTIGCFCLGNHSVAKKAKPSKMALSVS